MLYGLCGHRTPGAAGTTMSSAGPANGASRAALEPDPAKRTAGTLDTRDRAPLTPEATARSRRRPDWTLIPAPAIALAGMLRGIDARPYWGEQAGGRPAAPAGAPRPDRTHTSPCGGHA